jgi:L-ascorbate metabolism protein UlaG (beta-lactamase superfamily)
MEINWWGRSCFSVHEGGAVVVLDPFDQSQGYKPPRLKADIVTVSYHPQGSHIASLSGDFKLVDGPGEYEIRSVFITGIATYPKQRAGEDVQPPARNVVFALDFGGLVVCHLGNLPNALTQEQVEALGEVDVLLVPVGGGEILNASQAAEVVSRIEPRLVIPMHCRPLDEEGKGGAIDKFLKEMGGREVVPVDSLRVSSSNLPPETQVAVLNVTSR